MPDPHETLADVPVAASVNVAVCDCPDVHIVLMDEFDEPIARIALSPKTFETISAEALATVAAVLSNRRDPIGETAGTA